MGGRFVVVYDHPDEDDPLTARVITVWRRWPMVMRIEGHYDTEADIAWVRFEGYDPRTAVGEETDSGLRELDPVTGEVVGLEFWQASSGCRRSSCGCSLRRRSRSRPDGVFWRFGAEWWRVTAWTALSCRAAPTGSSWARIGGATRRAHAVADGHGAIMHVVANGVVDFNENVRRAQAAREGTPSRISITARSCAWRPRPTFPITGSIALCS